MNRVRLAIGSGSRLLLTVLLLGIAAVSSFAQLSASFTNQKDACDGLDNGSVDITVTGSSGPITVNIFGPPNFVLMPTDGVPEPVTGMKAKTYLVVVQDDDETVPYNITINNVTPDLSASLASSTNNTDCITPNGSISLNVSGGSGAYSFAWTGPPGYPSPANTQNVSGLIGGTYSVEVFDNNSNCSRVLGPFVLTDPVVAIQSITTASPLAVCPSNDAIISLSGSESGKTYEILVNGGASGFTSTGTGAPISITLPTGNFIDGDVLTVEGYEGICPHFTMTGSVTISMSTASVAPISATADITTYCDDAIPPTITLSYAGGTLGTGATAEWYDDAAFTSNIGTGNNLNIAAPGITSTYYVRFEGTCNITSGQNVTITVDNASVAPTGASVDNPSYCNNAAPPNITLSYSGGTLGTGASAEWYSDAGFTTPVGTGNNIMIAAPLTSTTYFVRFEGVCGNTSAQSVAVNVDIASIAPTSAIVDVPAFCDDVPPATITLSYAGGLIGTGATAEWYDDAAFTSNVGSGNNLTIATPAVTTTYYVRFEGSCNTTTGQNVTVTVNNASTAPTGAIVDAPVFCDDAPPVNITLSYAGGTLGTGATAEWYSDATFTTNVGNGNNLMVAAPTATTTYYVRFEGLCNTTTAQSVLVTVNNASIDPTNASVDSPSYCDNTPPANIRLTYTGGTLGTGATAEWYDDAGLTNNIGSGNNLSIPAPIATTTYYVRFEGICNTTAAQNVTVTVNNASTAPTSASVDAPLYCDDAAPVNITLSYAGGSIGTGATAEWYSDAAFTTNVGSGNNVMVVAPTATTTYYVRFEGLCNTTAAQSVTVTVNSASVAPTSATVDLPSYCDDAAPANIILSYTGGSLGTGATAEWYDDAGLTNNIGSGNNLSLSAPLVTTVYYVRFEGTCNTTADQNVTVTVNNASVAPASASVSDPAYCDDNLPAGGITLSYTGGSLGTGATAQWYDDAGFTNNVGSGNNLVINPAPSVSTTYFVRFEGTCGPTSGQSVAVTVSGASVAPTSASADVTNYCDNAMPANITLTYAGGNLGTGATAEWYSDATFTTNVGNGNNLVMAAPAITTTFYVRFEGACNTTADQSVTITVDLASTDPTAASVSDPSYCNDNLPVGGITLSYSGGSLGTGAIAQWYDDAGLTNNVGTGNNLVINPAPSVSTTYFVRLEGTCGNTNTQSVSVSVDGASTAPTGATVDNATYCDDVMPANITLTYSGGTLGTGASAVWYDDAGLTNTVGSGNNLVLAAPATTTTYYIRFEGSCNITTDQSVTVTVDNASVAPTLASVDLPAYCSDAVPANITLGYAGGSLGTGATAEWYDDATLTNNIGSGNNLVLAGPTVSTTYYVRFEGSCNTTSDQSVLVDVVALPDATITGVASTCANTSETYSVPAGATTYNWTLVSADGTISSGQGTNSITVDWGTQNGDLSVVVTGAAPTSCGATESLTVSVFSVLPPLADSSQDECQDSPLPTLIANPVVGGIVNWYIGSSATGTLVHTGTNYTPSATDLDMTSPGSTVFTYTQSISCLTSADATFTVNVIAKPNAGSDSTAFACIADPPVDLTTLLAGTPDLGGSWTDDDASGALSGSMFDPAVAGNGTYNFTYTVAGTGACATEQATAVVTVNVVTNSPDPQPGQLTYTTCTYGPAPTLSVPGNGIRWYRDVALSDLAFVGNDFTPVDGTDIDMTMQGTTSFYVTRDEGCGESNSVEITVVLQGVVAEIGQVMNTYPEQDIGAIEVINIFSDFPPYAVRLEDNASNVIYDWIDLQEDRLGDFSYLFTLLPAGDYVVQVRDANGCTYPLSQSIVNNTDIFIPNVFTPNGDNYNDYFKILNMTSPVKIIISNRWGVRVFESDDYQNDWQAENLPDGVYFYTIKMNGAVYKGNVEVWKGDSPGSN